MEKKNQKINLANDKWTSRQGLIIPFDKIEHAIAWFAIFIILRFVFPHSYAFFSACLTGFLWEVKDALMPYEKYGFWGGDGFSWKDFIADLFGIVLGVLIWAVV